jgi:hypothetical protein
LTVESEPIYMYPIVDSLYAYYLPFADASGGDDGGRSLLESDWRDRRLSWSSLFIPKGSKRFPDRHSSPAESAEAAGRLPNDVTTGWSPKMGEEPLIIFFADAAASPYSDLDSELLKKG